MTDDDDRLRPNVRTTTEIDDTWAIGAARATSLAMTASKVLMGLAVASALLGATEATSLAIGTSDLGGSAALFISQLAGALLASMLPAGLLGAASVFLRLQVSKFEVDLPD